MSPDAQDLQLFIMGRPVIVRSLDTALLSTMAEAYADWGRPEPADGPSIQLEVAVGEDAIPDAPRIAVEGLRLRMNGAGVEGWADAQSLTAFCKVSRDLAAEPRRLSAEATDTLLLFLLTRSGRVPLHAAGVMCGETAVILAGPSGSGKSTLSLAAMTGGLRILSDDTVYIQLQPRLRIWGFPRPLHVFPADAPGFTQGARLRAGKLKAVVPLAVRPEAPVADHSAVVLLERGDEIRLEPVEPSVAMAALSRLEPGFDLLARESVEAIAKITARGAWRLTLTRDPAAAIVTLVDRFGLSDPSGAAACA